MKTPVMILFFNRPEELRRVFEKVKKQRPEKLFLVQDGARKNNIADGEKIKKCREVVENIDWECEVYRNYSEENMTCDHREYTGIEWCFNYVDRLIVLEDDCVPSDSFFGLCEELLDRYEEDERIHMISGFNRISEYDNGCDYVFSKSSAGWGWATWKRAFERVQKISDLAFLSDEGECQKIKNLDKEVKKAYGDVITQGKRNRKKMEVTGKFPSWEYLFGMSMLLNDMLVITPTRNLIKYIGITEDATHCMANPKLLPSKVRKVLMQPSYEMEFPLKHPNEIARDKRFEKMNRKSMSYPPIVAKIEATFLKIRYGEWGLLKAAILKKFKELGKS